jgi:DNA-binding transcriptional ArsR family regulator
MSQAADIKQSDALDALGNPVRRRILALLSPGPKAVGAIAAQLPVSRPAVSKHLQILEKAELVSSERQGNRNLFRLQAQGFADARSWLDAYWDEALQRFAMVAENTKDRSGTRND